MRLSSKIELFIIISIGLIFTSCTVSGPFQPQTSHGKIIGDQLVIGNYFLLSSNDTLEGNIVGIGASLVIDKNALLKGDISLLGGTLDVYGTIEGTINTFAGISHIYKNAIIKGDINQYFNKALVDNGAQISGEINTFTFPRFPAQPFNKFINFLTQVLQPQKWIGLQLALVIIYSTFSVIASLSMKRRLSNMVTAVQKQPVVSWIFGILGAMIFPLAGLILILTFCFAPVGILLIIIGVLLTCLGWIVMGSLTGKVLQYWFHTKWPEELQAFMGSMLFGLTTSMLNWLPCIGWTITFCLGITGLGGLFLSRFGAPVAIKEITKPVPESPSRNLTNIK